MRFWKCTLMRMLERNCQISYQHPLRVKVKQQHQIFFPSKVSFLNISKNLNHYVENTTRIFLAADASITSNPSACTAMDENGPAECKFPFKNPHTGTVHSECTDEGYEGTGMKICATELEADGITMNGAKFAVCCCPDCPAGISATTETSTELVEDQEGFLLYYFFYDGYFAKLKEEQPMPVCMDGESNNDARLIMPALFMGPGKWAKIQENT